MLENGSHCSLPAAWVLSSNAKESKAVLSEFTYAQGKSL